MSDISTKGSPHARSAFHLPIPANDGKIHGRTRSWGAIDRQSKEAVMSAVIDEANGLTLPAKALVLAVMELESGFNPDAAAKSSSASGLGQLIEKTAAAYGLKAQDRFDIRANTRATIRYLGDCWKNAAAKFKPSNLKDMICRTYALYHDGPSLRFGGLALAKNKLLPLYEKFLASLGDSANL